MTQEEVMDKHPEIFRERTMSVYESCLACGLEVGDGWLPIIDKFCDQLDTLAKETGVQVIAQQVKEKFGGLRFYYMTEVPAVGIDENWVAAAGQFIRDMEIECDRTCESCGKPGSTKGSKGWLCCLCVDCRSKTRG